MKRQRIYRELIDGRVLVVELQPPFDIELMRGRVQAAHYWRGMFWYHTGGKYYVWNWAKIDVFAPPDGFFCQPVCWEVA